MAGQKNMSVLTKSRDPWIDNIKGILMILVVTGHMLASVINKYPPYMVISNTLNFFHMPAFLIVSGYLMKRRINERDTASLINKNVVPYIMAQLVMYVAACIVPSGLKAVSVSSFQSISDFNIFSPIYQLWYFFALIIGYVFCVILKPAKRPALAIIIAVGLSVAVGFVPEMKTFRLIKVVGFFPFFLLGYLVPENAFEFIKKKKLLALGGAAALGGAVAAFIMLLPNGTYDFIFAMTKTYMEYPDRFTITGAVLSRALFLCIATVLSLAFFSICPRKKCIITKLGERSLYVFVLHAIFIMIIRSVNYETPFLYKFKTPLLVVFYILFCIGIAFICASDPVYKVFNKILEPGFDIRKLGEYFSKKDSKSN